MKSTAARSWSVVAPVGRGVPGAEQRQRDQGRVGDVAPLRFERNTGARVASVLAEAAVVTLGADEESQSAVDGGPQGNGSPAGVRGGHGCLRGRAAGVLRLLVVGAGAGVGRERRSEGGNESDAVGSHGRLARKEQGLRGGDRGRAVLERGSLVGHSLEWGTGKVPLARRDQRNRTSPTFSSRPANSSR